MNYRNLLAAIMLQAAKDYTKGDASQRRQILRDLRSDYMTALSDSQSGIIAEQLEKRPAEIRARLRKMTEED